MSIKEPKIRKVLGKYKEGLLAILRYKTSSIGFMIVLIITITAIGASIIAPKHYSDIDLENRFRPPSLEFPFGTDPMGRDVFSRVIYGTRLALWVATLVVSIEVVIGVGLGLISGYYGGTLDKIIMAVADLLWALPGTVVALGIVIVIGPGLNQVVIAIALLSWPYFTRITRVKTQSLLNRDFILAARSIGESDFSIMYRYLLPNIMPTILILISLSVPSAILATTALSFLGFGAQPPTADWGVMLSDGASQLMRAPWVATFPGIFITITSLGFNLLGEGLRDILDPRLKI